MKLVFKKIQMHDFMSFSDEVFDFDRTSGMVLIRGKNNDVPNETNGAGKSTIGYSLLYALFGQLQNKIKNENIINRKSRDRDMRLVLDFSVDSESYRVERGIQKGRSSYFNLFKTSDGDENITKSTIQETQKYLENEILRCDISIFLRTIMLTADQTYNFYMLKKQDKKEFVERLFDIGVFGEMYSAIHKDLLALDRQALARQNQLMVLNQNMSDYQARSDRFNAEHGQRVGDLASKYEKLAREYEILSGSDVSVNEDALGKLQDALHKLQEAQVKCEREGVKLQDISLKSDYKIREAELYMRKNQESIDEKSALLGILCDECLGKADKYFKLDVCRDEIAGASKTLESAKGEKAETLLKIENNRKTQSEYEKKIQLAQSRIQSLTAESNAIKGRLRGVERDMQAAMSDLQSEKNKENPYTDLMRKGEEQIKAETANVGQIVKKIQYLKFAESIVSQDTLRKFIIKDLIGILNNRIRKYLISLGAKYYVQFDDDMDYEFVPTVGTCEFGNFSAGERMRLMIATSFAFRDFMSIRNGLCSNILILDEYFDGAISSVCIESLMKILKEYINESSQNIFIISQRPEVQLDNFDKIVQVEKTNDVSHITYV